MKKKAWRPSPQAVAWNPTSEAAAFRSKPKRRNGEEKKGLWSESSSYTVDGGHFFIMASCCSGFTTLSCLVLMYTRGTFSTTSPPPSLNCALVNARNGPGLNSISAKVESWPIIPLFIPYMLTVQLYIIYIYMLHAHAIWPRKIIFDEVVFI